MFCMLTGRQKAKVQYLSALVERRNDMIQRLGNSQKCNKVGEDEAESLAGKNVLTGAGKYLDDIANDSRYRINKLYASSGFADPQVLSFTQFISVRSAPVGASRPIRDLGESAIDAVYRYISDDYQVGVFIFDTRREGRIYVPTTEDYRTLVSRGSIKRARDMAMAVGSNTFTLDEVKNSDTLTIARYAGRRFSHTNLVADLDVNQVYTELNELSSDWDVAVGRRRRRHSEFEASERIRAFVTDFLPEYDEVVEDMYLRMSRFLSEPRRVAVMFGDFWHTDTGHFESLCTRDNVSWAEFVPILVPKEEEDDSDKSST